MELEELEPDSTQKFFWDSADNFYLIDVQFIHWM